MEEERTGFVLVGPDVWIRFDNAACARLRGGGGRPFQEANTAAADMALCHLL